MRRERRFIIVGMVSLVATLAISLTLRSCRIGIVRGDAMVEYKTEFIRKSLVALAIHQRGYNP